MADNLKLLLVDDNPMVLAMLQQALSSLATVTTATDAADALLKAVDDVPDLLVGDYRMPGMDGRQLFEKLKSRPATANFSSVLMASKADIAERLSPQDAADDYLEKPFFLKDATRRIKRLIDRIALEKMAKTAPSDGVVRGNLSQMNVIDLMQSLEMGRKAASFRSGTKATNVKFFVRARSSTPLTDRWSAIWLCSRSCADRRELQLVSRARRTRRPRLNAGTSDGRLRRSMSRPGTAAEKNLRLRRQHQPRSLPRRLRRLYAEEKTKRKTFFSMADPKSVLTAAVVTVSDSCARGERKMLPGRQSRNCSKNSSSL
jgi:CheY-like chemotaxis protein